MKSLSRKKKNNIIIASLCAIVVLMGIGYAAFASQLRINGTSSISSEWKVLITDITSGSIVGGASNASEPTHTETTATFSTNLISPGDSITYTIKVENQGTIDATLTSIYINTGSNDAIVFETSGISEGDNLLQGATDELYVKVSYSNSVTSQPENTTSNITVTLNYEQTTGGVVPGGDSTSIGGQDVEIVDSGDGLYEDTYEPGRYIYKGANPNNYITFNNETWRIISVESDGTIKIMRNESIGNMAWDSSSSHNWTRPADLNTYLNEEYYNGLTETAKGQIEPHNWGIGAITDDNNDLSQEIQGQNSETWNGNIGLISSSDYLRANTNTTQCGTHMLNDDNHSICKTTDWIYSIVPSSGFLWTISSRANDSYGVFYVSSVGAYDGQLRGGSSIDIRGVSPALYLSSSIVLEGKGTESNPFRIIS